MRIHTEVERDELISKWADRGLSKGEGEALYWYAVEYGPTAKECWPPPDDRDVVWLPPPQACQGRT
jgi:hypothetical protein